MTGRGWFRLAVVVAMVAQLGLLGFARWVRSPVTLALGELAWALLVAVALLGYRYLALRQRFRREVEQRRRLAERQRVADALHDLVGHEISLIAMQAGLLELRTEGATAELAAQLRTRADLAVTSLHESIDLLDVEGHPDAGSRDDLEGLVDRYREAGADISVHGTLPDTGALVHATAVAVLREALTNAARHAPGRPVVVQLTEAQGGVQVAVTVTGAPRTEQQPSGGHGLDSLRRRVHGLGGALVVEHDERAHAVTARLPLAQAVATAAGQPPVATRPTRSLLREAGIPIAAVVVVTIAFYAWATHGAVIEPGRQTTLAVGMSRAAAEPLLPARQAPVRLIRPTPHPGDWRCESYTNGNFPLGIATLEVCFHAGTTVRVTDLAEKRLW